MQSERRGVKIAGIPDDGFLRACQRTQNSAIRNYLQQAGAGFEWLA